MDVRISQGVTGHLAVDIVGGDIAEVGVHVLAAKYSFK